jgi:copine 5/8/9
MSKDAPSQYEVALRSVGQIIQDYDSDKQFPVLGFGARVPPTNQVSHEFFVNLSSSPFCSGVDGVAEAYRKCVQCVMPHGAVNFAPIIRHVTRFAASYKNGDHYFILLILTCGSICDMPETKQALIDASTLPLSVIIVGIGKFCLKKINFAYYSVQLRSCGNLHSI